MCIRDRHNNIGIWVIAGVLLQILLENLTKGFEHGHFHHHHESKSILPMALMIGMFIHAFLEGIPLANQEQTLSPYLTGILVHNIPISFILGAFSVSYTHLDVYKRQNLCTFFVPSYISYCMKRHSNFCLLYTSRCV